MWARDGHDYNFFKGLNCPGRGGVLTDRIEGKWIDAFARAFELCKVEAGEAVAILSETQSRAVNVNLAELALQRLGARPFHVVLPTPPQRAPVPVRSTGASDVVQGLEPVIAALGQAGLVVDLTVEEPDVGTIIEGVMRSRASGAGR